MNSSTTQSPLTWDGVEVQKRTLAYSYCSTPQCTHYLIPSLWQRIGLITPLRQLFKGNNCPTSIPDRHGDSFNILYLFPISHSSAYALIIFSYMGSSDSNVIYVCLYLPLQSLLSIPQRQGASAIVPLPVGGTWGGVALIFLGMAVTFIIQNQPVSLCGEGLEKVIVSGMKSYFILYSFSRSKTSQTLV